MLNFLATSLRGTSKCNCNGNHRVKKATDAKVKSLGNENVHEGYEMGEKTEARCYCT